MQIGFDNDWRLRRKYYLFEYKGIRFKLFQNNPRKWSDCLLTILPDSSDKYREATYTIASEFLSALSWKLKSRIHLGGCGGCGWKSNSPLSKGKPSSYTFPRIPFEGNKVGCKLNNIPKVETDYQRAALSLYREANASNNYYLSFLFYWQVLETRNTKAIDYVNNVYRKKRRELKLNPRYISSLPLNAKALGNYLLDDCRHAIAHIRRKPGSKKLTFDRLDERERITYSVFVIKAFAEHYISHSIGLSGSLYLARKAKNSFPVFADEDFISKHGLTTAYSEK